MKYAKIKKINQTPGKLDGWHWYFRTYYKTKKGYDPVHVNFILLHVRDGANEVEVKEYCYSLSTVELAAKYRTQLRSEWKKKCHNDERLIDDSPPTKKNMDRIEELKEAWSKNPEIFAQQFSTA